MLCECNQIENEYHGLYSIFLGSIVPYLAQTNDFPSLTPAVPKPEAVQNPVQYLHAEGRMAKQPQNRKNHNLPVCNNMRNGDENYLYEMAPVGLELPNRNNCKTDHLHDHNISRGAESGALYDIDPDLQTIIDAWPAFPQAVKAGILVMAKASKA